MEIVKSDVRTMTLDRFRIERGEIGGPVKIRAWLTVLTPSQDPSEMRIRVDYQYDDIPNQTERELGRRVVELLRNRL